MARTVITKLTLEQEEVFEGFTRSTKLHIIQIIKDEWVDECVKDWMAKSLPQEDNDEVLRIRIATGMQQLQAKHHLEQRKRLMEIAHGRR
jgi:hypothetical protein